MKRKPRVPKRQRSEITDYDGQVTSAMIDGTKPLTLKQIGIELPRVPPTQVVSKRRRATRSHQPCARIKIAESHQT